MDIRSTVECFHLLFLEQWSKKVSSGCYSLKGGCNLRFFFGSPRYSEDMDLDIEHIAVATLKKHIESLSASSFFQKILKSKGIEMVQYSSPKQTQTTQRWKITLKQQHSGVEVHTKIETSRRGRSHESQVELVPSNTTSRYAVKPFFVNHYILTSAIEQKIEALAYRSETQARDIFDLFYLFHLSQDFPASNLSQDCISQALGNMGTIDFESFKAQVVAYLDREEQEHYGQKQAWDTIVSRVWQALEMRL